jgi:hypothetical protein
MANTPSLNDSNLCFGIGSPVADDRLASFRSCGLTSRRRRWR